MPGLRGVTAFQGAAEPASPGRQRRPLEGVERSAAGVGQIQPAAENAA